MLKNEEIKIRVPGVIKEALKAVADSRMTSESEIAREALLEYLAKKGIGVGQLRDATAPYFAPPSEPRPLLNDQEKAVAGLYTARARRNAAATAKTRKPNT